MRLIRFIDLIFLSVDSTNIDTCSHSNKALEFRNVSNITQFPHLFYQYAKLLDMKRCSLVAFSFVYTQDA